MDKQSAQYSELPIKTASVKGFSLVELLIVIAIIGTIAAIAVPVLSGIFEKSRKGAINQNAQNLATLFAGARAAGATFDTYDKETVINALTSSTGVHGNGRLESMVFKLPLSSQDVVNVKNSVDLVAEGSGDDFRLVYIGSSN